MSQIEDVQIKVDKLSGKIAELEKIPTSIKQLNEHLGSLVNAETFHRKISDITAKIEELSSVGKIEGEKAEIKKQISGKKNELWRKVFLWDKLKLLTLAATILLTLATAYVLKMNPANISDPVKTDLSAGLSLLAALSALLHLSFTLGNTKNSVSTYNSLKGLEILEMDLTNPALPPETARHRYDEIIKAD